MYDGTCAGLNFKSECTNVIYNMHGERRSIGQSPAAGKSN